MYKLDAAAAHVFFEEVAHTNVAMIAELTRLLGGRFGRTVSDENSAYRRTRNSCVVDWWLPIIPPYPGCVAQAQAI